jgi:putative N6-adenine-specific DNA methylase
VKKPAEQLFAATAPGLEGVCAAELIALGMAGVKAVAGGVEFCGALRELYLANLWLRTASRVVVRFGELRCRDFPSLYRKALQLPWGRFVKPGTRLQVRATCRRSRLQHTERIADTLQKAMTRALGGTSPEEKEPTQRLIVSLEDDQCRLSLDSSGELLHRRGYRQDVGAAPLRETLAAGILMLLGWQGERPLFDPMCGSGTFLIEGALLALQRPPGAGRKFAFMDWPRYRPGLWQALLIEAAKQEKQCCPLLAGADRDAEVLNAARRNALRAGVADYLLLQPLELSQQVSPPSSPGLALSNPPYGARLGRGEVDAIYRDLGRVYQQVLRGWERAFLCPDPRLAQITGLPLTQVAGLQNGGIRVGLYTVK